MTPCAPQPSRTLQHQAQPPFPRAPAPATAPTFHTRSTAFRYHHRTSLPRRPPTSPSDRPPHHRPQAIHRAAAKAQLPAPCRPLAGGFPSRSRGALAYPLLH
ncbi:hypothetical protein CONLIGDRAFT_679687 [Coniochaeta ligniaria NRRL 30616]|uniref:Uncharacterized protein n=1 Tax=Coniochaeta ligniaria NRRL 30616 TaxID=1408157 RepID=A0A1J7JM39_9PEZI|nr:hypothetical protein CONLIGDRAFT_679687 [Coniochaeta ligniaria NRRL 30616]